MSLAGTATVMSSMEDVLTEEYNYHRPKRGDVLEGEVLIVEPDEVIVDIGVKRDAIISKRDLSLLAEEEIAQINVGAEVPVYVLRPRNRDGELIGSLNLGLKEQDWQRAQEMLDRGEIFEGKVSGYNRGGLLVPFGRIRGFVPASHIPRRYYRQPNLGRQDRLSSLVGETLPLRIIEVNRRRRRLILSVRAAERTWRRQQKEQLLEELKVGEIRHGTVSHLCDFGAFVDLGGADGLIHISELSWDHLRHPNEILEEGQEVDVYVLRLDKERGRIGLSLKRLEPDPWETIQERYFPGQIVQGCVTGVVDFGAFVRLEPGIEGLLHVSEISENHIDHPKDMVQRGDILTLQVISLEPQRRRIGFSLRRMTVDQPMPLDSPVAK
jgi:small subunit ribosomal protein S1